MWSARTCPRFELGDMSPSPQAVSCHRPPHRHARHLNPRLFHWMLGVVAVRKDCWLLDVFLIFTLTPSYPMKRTGKIARLPRTLRDQLNQRLYNGEPGVELIKWLNALPEVQALLAEHFNGVPISPQNLSEWNNGGFLDWLAIQDLLESAREFAADAAQLPGFTDGHLADCLAHTITARYAVLLNKMPLDGPIPPDVLAQYNLLLRLHRMTFQVQRRALQARKDRLAEAQAERKSTPVAAATPPSQKSGGAAPSQKVPATPPSPHPSPSPTPAILPALAIPPRPKTSPALAGFYQKP